MPRRAHSPETRPNGPGLHRREGASGVIDNGIDGWRKYLNDEQFSTTAHLEDSFKSGDFETDTLEVTFSIGETVRITARDFAGQTGEVACVEPDALTGVQ